MFLNLLSFTLVLTVLSIHPSLIYLRILCSVVLGWSLIPAHIRRDTGNTHGTHMLPVYLSANTCRQTAAHTKTHTTGLCSLFNSPACPLDYGRKPEHPLAHSWTFSRWGGSANHWTISCQSNAFTIKMFHVNTVKFCMCFSGLNLQSSCLSYHKVCLIWLFAKPSLPLSSEI